MPLSALIGAVVTFGIILAASLVLVARVRAWAREGKINRVRYIIAFATLVCVVCSVMVSAAATFLKGRQDANVLLDKQRNVLAVSGLMEEGEKLGREEVQRLFDERITMILIDLRTDLPAAAEVDIDPATYDQRRALKDPGQRERVEANFAKVTHVPHLALVYEVYTDSTKDQLVLRVFPVEGMGLWGTLYGFVALDQDGATIRGLTFYEHKETPGLGAEVDNPRWKAKWPGRKAYDEAGVPKIAVIKGAAGPPEEAPHEVDGLSGATITSRGVTNLLRFWLSEDGYGPYLASLRGEGSTS